MKIEGKVFLITGGCSGLGEATVHAVLAKGGKTAIVDVDKKKGPGMAAELGPNAEFFETNLLKEESIAATVEAVIAKFGRIDGCVNCAGTGLGSLTVSKKGVAHSMKKFEFIVRLNLIGTFSVLSKCAAQMVKQTPEDSDGERGIIINVASVAAIDGQNGQAAYSASKAGVVGMTLPIARDLGTRGVRINTICPGVFATALTAGMETEAGKRVGDSLKKQQVFPNTRFGNPAEFAHLAVAIMENKMINGETIRLDAGIRMPKL